MDCAGGPNGVPSVASPCDSPGVNPLPATGVQPGAAGALHGGLAEEGGRDLEHALAGANRQLLHGQASGAVPADHNGESGLPANSRRRVLDRGKRDDELGGLQFARLDNNDEGPPALQ